MTRPRKIFSKLVRALPKNTMIGPFRVVAVRSNFGASTSRQSQQRRLGRLNVLSIVKSQSRTDISSAIKRITPSGVLIRVRVSDAVDVIETSGTRSAQPFAFEKSTMNEASCLQPSSGIAL
jgi:hypothetical protein